MNSLQKFKPLIDLTPVVAFFGVYFLYDILTATAALLIALVLQLLLYYILKLEITKQLWVFGAIGLVFGGITLLLGEGIFIKLRPAVVSSCIVVVLLVMEFIAKKNPIKMLLGKNMVLPDRAWRGFTLIIVTCLAINAIINIFIAYTQSDDFWITYRLVSAFVAPSVILLSCFLYLRVTKQSAKLLDSDHNQVRDE